MSLFLVCLFMFSSCSEDIENPPWNVEVVPVVFSVITPAQAVQVYVGKSYSGNENSNTTVYSTPRVYVSEKDSAWVELEQTTKDSTLFIDTKALLKVDMGKTYLLKVESLGKTVFAQTTLPSESGIITVGECVIVSGNAGGSTNGTNYTSNLCALNVHLKLPTNKEYGCYLTAFSDRIDGFPFLSSENYLNANFTISKKISSFQLNIVTIDPYLKKFMLAESVSSNMFDSNDITEVLASYGGVYPAFSNIRNGVGLFGSFLIDGKSISVTQKETED
jgi:hypothetical protein